MIKKTNVPFIFALPMSIRVLDITSDATLLFQKDPAVTIVLDGKMLFDNCRYSMVCSESEIVLLEGNTPARISAQTDTKSSCTIMVLTFDTDYYGIKYPLLKDLFFNEGPIEGDGFFVSGVLNLALTALSKGVDSYNTIQIETDHLISTLINNYLPFSNGPDNTDSTSRQLSEHGNLIYDLVLYCGNNFNNRATLQEFADNCHISSNYASHLIKKLCGKSFQDILSRVRCMKAQEYLLDEGYRLNELAFDMGFSSPSYFKKHFMRIIGVSPSKYRSIFLDADFVPPQKEYNNDAAVSRIKQFAEAHQISLSIMTDVTFTHDNIDVNHSKGEYENLLSDLGRISNIKAPLSEASHQIFDEMHKEFRMSIITIDVLTSLQDNEPQTLVTISRNINYLINLGFTVALETKNLSRQCIEMITDFLKFYSNLFRSNASLIKILIRSNASEETVLSVRRSLATHILSSAGLNVDVISANEYIDEVEYLPAIYDSFLLTPFAMDELLNPQNWPKEIAFSLIDGVTDYGTFQSGGYGLMTWNGIKKPWWYAYLLVANLHGVIVSQGPDHMITNDNGRIVILTYNLCRESGKLLETIHTLDQLNDAIDRNRNIRREHSFNLSGLHGKYKATRYSINKNCCIYSKWASLGYPSYMTGEEESIISTMCHPQMSFDIIETSGSIDITTIEESFGVSLVILEKM